MALTGKDQKTYEKWLQNHALMGSSTLDDLEAFHLMVGTVNEVNSYVGRQVSLIAVFLVAHGLLKKDPLLTSFESDSSSRLEQEIEKRLNPVYNRDEVLMFMEACLFLCLEISAAGRTLQIKPDEKGDVVAYSTIDLEQQASFINKLSVDDPKQQSHMVIKSTEFKSIVSSFRHILKNMRFMALLPEVLDLAAKGRNKKQIMEQLDLNQAQLFRLFEIAKDRADPNMDEYITKIMQKKPKVVKKVPQYHVTLTPNNYAYIRNIATEQFNGSLYNAVNGLISSFRDLVNKNIVEEGQVLNNERREH